MIYESIIIKFILKFSNTARIKYKQSLTAALINSCLKFLHNLLIESYIYNMVAREGKISGLWYSGRIYLSLEKFCTGIQHKLINTNLRCVDYLKSGIFYRILCTIASYTHVIMAVSIFIMLVVPHSVWNDAYDPIIAAIMLILFLMKIATGGKSQFHIQFINFYLFVFMLSVVLSEIFSISPLSSLKFFIFYLTCFLLVLLLISSISSIKELEQVIFIILLGVLLAGIYGVYQGIVGVPVNPSEVDLNLNQDMPGRVFSTFFNTNNFAEVLAMLLPFGIACFLNSSYFKRKLFTFIILIPPVIALLMTYSRSIWVGFAAALLIITFFKNKKLVPVFMVLLLLMLPLLPQSIYRRVLTITNFQDSSIKFRFDLYTTLWPVLKDYWLTGIGTGTDTFRMVVQNYSLGLIKGQIPPHSHNVLLQIWLETGIVGAVSFLGFMLGTLKKGIKAILNSPDKRCKNIIIAGIASITGILAVSFAEYVWYYPRVMMIFWIVVGLTLAAIKLSLNEKNIYQ